jgi:hypothetical protein
MTDESLAYLDSFENPNVPAGCVIRVGRLRLRVIETQRLLGGFRTTLERVVA